MKVVAERLRWKRTLFRFVRLRSFTHRIARFNYLSLFCCLRLLILRLSFIWKKKKKQLQELIHMLRIKVLVLIFASMYFNVFVPVVYGCWFSLLSLLFFRNPSLTRFNCVMSTTDLTTKIQMTMIQTGYRTQRKDWFRTRISLIPWWCKSETNILDFKRPIDASGILLQGVERAPTPKDQKATSLWKLGSLKPVIWEICIRLYQRSHYGPYVTCVHAWFLRSCRFC